MTMMKNKTHATRFPELVLALTALASTLSAASCQQEKAYQNPLTPVRVGQVEAYQGGGGVRYSANIVPEIQVDLAFRSGGYVQHILQVKGVDGRSRDVQEGDLVSKGAVLAQVREDDYVVRVNQARQQVAQAKAVLEAARSQLLEAKAAYNQAQLDFTRAGNLFASRSLTKPDYDAAKTRLDSTQDRVAAANSQVEAGQAQVGAADEAVKAAEIPLTDAALKSPMGAVVLRRTFEVGSLVGPGTTGFVLADISSVKAVFGVPDVMMERVKLGTAQTISSEAVPDRFEGRITAISPSADPKSRVFSVEVSIPNPRGQLKPGMIATLTLGEEKPATAVLAIPLSSVVRSTENPDGFAVFVVVDQDGRSLARIRNVELGEVYGNRVGVKKGLTLEDRVITTGATLVKDGEQVRVIH